MQRTASLFALTRQIGRAKNVYTWVPANGSAAAGFFDKFIDFRRAFDATRAVFLRDAKLTKRKPFADSVPLGICTFFLKVS